MTDIVGMASRTAVSDAATSAGETTKDLWKSRAVLRVVQPGSWVECKLCNEQVKYQVRAHNMQMICNVYRNGVWDRVEHFHADCYGEAGEPYGEAVEN